MPLLHEIILVLAQFVYYAVLALFAAALFLWIVGHRKINAVESAARAASSRDRNLYLYESDLMASQTPPPHVPPRRLSFSATTPRPSSRGDGDTPAVEFRRRQAGGKDAQELASSTTRRVRFSLTPSQESKERRNINRETCSEPYRSPGVDARYRSSLVELFPSRKLPSKMSFDSPAAATALSKQLEETLAPRMDDRAFRTLSGPHQSVVIPAHESLGPITSESAAVSGPQDPSMSLPCSDPRNHEDAIPYTVSRGIGSANSTVRADENIKKTFGPEHGPSSFGKVGVSRFETKARLLAPGVTQADFVSRCPRNLIGQRGRPNAVQAVNGRELADEVSPPSIIPLEMDCAPVEHKENLQLNQYISDSATSKRVRFGVAGLPQAVTSDNPASARFSSSKSAGEGTSKLHMVGGNSMDSRSESLRHSIYPAESSIAHNSEQEPGKPAKHPVERKSAPAAQNSDLSKEDCMKLKETCGTDIGRDFCERASATPNCSLDEELSPAELAMARRLRNILFRVAPRKLAGAINQIEDVRLRAAVQSMLTSNDS
jgi:hypothetical protein